MTSNYIRNVMVALGAARFLSPVAAPLLYGKPAVWQAKEKRGNRRNRSRFNYSR